MTRKLNVSVLVVDDFKEWRDQVRRLLEARPEWTVVAEACDGCEAAAKATELQPDVVLLDLALPTMNGMEAAKIIRQKCPTSKIVFVSQNTDGDIVQAAIALGHGYVLKTKARNELLDAISNVLGR